MYSIARYVATYSIVQCNQEDAWELACMHHDERTHACSLPRAHFF